MNNKVILIYKKDARYPAKSTGFRPSVRYPEFGDDSLNIKDNDIFDMVRNALFKCGLDADNYGTSLWNPLGIYISEGDTVLIKPNLVMHNNPAGTTDCLYTNPSVVAPIIEYVLIALNGKGKIIVGDAPLQECVFDELVEKSGYKELIEYYKKKGVCIELKDFRNTKTYIKNGMHYLQEEGKLHDNGMLVKLDEDSAFEELDSNKIKNLRVTNYDPRIMNKHHSCNQHEYMIAKDFLEADVVVNVPKIKTHRIAGVTISMKNLIGVNANKELLPHHRLGSKDEGGDAYEHKSETLQAANDLKDKVNILNAMNKQGDAAKVEEDYIEKYTQGIAETKEKYWNGFWHGNDTIWRTIVDLNRIFLYADKAGIIQDNPQRKMIIIGDMVVAGEKEGPLNPSPIDCGTIAMGTDPVVFDRTICSLMGYNWRLIPSLNNDYLHTNKRSISNCDNPIIVSNNDNWADKDLDYIRGNASFEFEPTQGWSAVLPSRLRKETLEKLLGDEKIFIFGAGLIGHKAYSKLVENGISVYAFVDNDKAKQGTIIVDGVECISPDQIPPKCKCIIAVGTKYISDIEEQLCQMNIQYVFKWSELNIGLSIQEA